MDGLARVFILIEGLTLDPEAIIVVTDTDTTEDITTVITVGMRMVPEQVMQRDQETQMCIKTVQLV